MLIVSRVPGQSILIGKEREIEVFILGVDGMQVRVGINAPRSIRVLRRELLTNLENPQTKIFLQADSSPIGNNGPADADTSSEIQSPQRRGGERFVPESVTPPPPDS